MVNTWHSVSPHAFRTRRRETGDRQKQARGLHVSTGPRLGVQTKKYLKVFHVCTKAKAGTLTKQTNRWVFSVTIVSHILQIFVHRVKRTWKALAHKRGSIYLKAKEPI